jgi:1-acyl-sn-glycerol-3-phosphate acyltransferase
MSDRLETLIAAIRSVAAYLFLAVYVGLSAPIGMVLAILFRWKGILYVLGHGGVRSAMAILGIRYRIAGAENLPRDHAAVYCANHQSNVDPPLLFTALHPRLHVFYKAELRSLSVLEVAFRVGGFVPVDRHNREQAMAAIETAARSLKAGNSFLIFPDGTRSRTGELLPFKKGGFVMAIKAQVPIVPVAVQGGRSAMRKGSAVVRPALVSVRVGTPVSTAGRSPGDRDEIVKEVRGQIEKMLEMGPIGNIESS